MEIVEDTLDAKLEDFLARPLFCHLGTLSEDGPRVSPLWFLWEDGAIWIIATLSDKHSLIVSRTIPVPRSRL